MTMTMPSLARASKHTAKQIPRSAAEKMWLVGGVLVGLLLVVIGYFTLITGQQSDTSHVNSRIGIAHTTNVALQGRLSALRSQDKNLGAYKMALAQAQLALPSTADVSNFLRTLQSIGSTTSTTVSGVTIGTPTAVVAAAGAPATDPAAAAPSPAAVADAAAAPIFSMSIGAQISGTDASLDKFLRQLQGVQPRAVLVTGVQEGTAANGGPAGAVTGSTPGSHLLSLTMLAFIAPTKLTVPVAPSAAPTSSP